MTITLRLFARARDLAGSEFVTMPVRRGTTVGELKSLLAVRYPALQRLIPTLLVAMNNDYVGDGQVLDDAVELACFPPVSGG